jgi:AraC family transcriptional regulator
MSQFTLIDSYYFSRPIESYTSERIEHRIVDCYEIELITESNGGMYIDGEFSSIKKGDLIFRYPGQTTQGVLPYSCYTLRFQCSDSIFLDFAQKNIPPICGERVANKLSPIVEEIFNESINRNTISDYFFDYQLAKLRYTLFSLFHPNEGTSFQNSKTNNLYVNEAITYIQTNWREITICELVDYIGISKPYLMKLFKKETGKTLLQYIDETKIRHIKKMLIFTNDSITDIAFSSGFKTSSYFTNYMVKHTGLTPKQLRKKYTG